MFYLKFCSYAGSQSILKLYMTTVLPTWSMPVWSRIPTSRRVLRLLKMYRIVHLKFALKIASAVRTACSNFPQTASRTQLKLFQLLLFNVTNNYSPFLDSLVARRASPYLTSITPKNLATLSQLFRLPTQLCFFPPSVTKL